MRRLKVKNLPLILLATVAVVLAGLGVNRIVVAQRHSHLVAILRLNTTPQLRKPYPVDVLRLQDQHTAVSGLFKIAASHFVPNVDEAASVYEERLISEQVEVAAKHATDYESRGPVLFALARTCLLYRSFDLDTIGYDSPGHAGSEESYYFGVFDDAFWVCCEKIARIPGEGPHTGLMLLRKDLTDPPYSQMDDLIDAQAALGKNPDSHR